MQKRHDSAISRRQLLKSGLSAWAGVTLVPRHVLGGQGYIAPSDKLNIAMIGTGGQGLRNLKSILPFEDVQVIALADVTEKADYSQWYFKDPGGREPGLQLITTHDQQTKSRHTPRCKSYVDFRDMLDQVKEIDAVIISIPDHTHYVAAMACMQRGKHVYLEKPLARTLYETRKLVEMADQSRVITQMGIQGHAGEGLRLTAEWLWDGAIGQVREIHAWSSSASRSGCLEGQPQGHPPVPRGLDWRLWLGPAEYRPYHPAYTPVRWRDFWDFGTGKIGDMGCHHMDPAFFALDLRHPEWIEARSAWGDKDKRPFASIVTFHFKATGMRDSLDLTWYSGLTPPRPEELEPGRQLGERDNGILFIGDKGKMVCGGWAGSPRLIPEKHMQNYSLPRKTLPRVEGPHREWINGCKTGQKTGADFSYSGPLTQMVLLGVMAIRLEERIYWDADTMTIINHPEAESWIHPEYHNGWTL